MDIILEKENNATDQIKQSHKEYIQQFCKELICLI